MEGIEMKKAFLAIKNNIRQRFVCKPFCIWCEKVCKKGQNGDYWLGDDGCIYYGERWLVFFKSAQNKWWIK